MILQGTIIDKQTKQPIPFASITVISSKGVYTGAGASADYKGYFYIDTGIYEDGYFIKATSIGYQPATDLLYSDYNVDWSGIIALDRQDKTLPEVVVTSSASNKNWLWLLAAVPLLIDNKNSQVSKIDKGDVLAVGLGLLLLKGFGMLDKLLNSLGLGGNPTANQQSDPGSPWNPSYWRKLYTTQEQQYIWEDYGERYNQLGLDIWSAFSILSDNYTAVKAVFDQMRSKAEVSFLAEQFYKSQGQSLLSFLSDAGPAPWDGLSHDHLQIIVDYVNRLPNKI